MVKIQTILNDPKPPTIMGIDASTNSLAFSVFKDQELVSYGKINFKGSTPYDKVVDAAKKVRGFIDLYPEVEAIVIEHTVFMNSPKTAADLALVQGGLLGAAGVPLIRSVAPITWQNYIGNKKPSKEELFKIKSENPGKSDSWIKTHVRELRKQKTMKLIDIIYDRIVTDNDVADAIGIGHYAVNNWERLTK